MARRKGDYLPGFDPRGLAPPTPWDSGVLSEAEGEVWDLLGTCGEAGMVSEEVAYALPHRNTTAVLRKLWGRGWVEPFTDEKKRYRWRRRADA